jgi:hypothetical protein
MLPKSRNVLDRAQAPRIAYCLLFARSQAITSGCDWKRHQEEYRKLLIMTGNARSRCGHHTEVDVDAWPDDVFRCPHSGRACGAKSAAISALMLGLIGSSGQRDCRKAPDDGGSAAERRATSSARYGSCAS